MSFSNRKNTVAHALRGQHFKHLAITDRLSEVVGSLISPVQTAFVKGRYIIEGVLILHKALNSIHAKKSKVSCFLKLVLRRHMIKSTTICP